MSDEARSLEDLAARVADGLAVDWDQAIGSAASNEDRQAMRQLRLMQSVSRVHGAAEAAALDPASDTLPATVATHGATSGSVPALGMWGHLELRERLSEGNYGELYRAWDPQLDREVALKLLKAPREEGESSLAAALVREGRLLAKVRHPNVVTVYGADLRAGRAGIWMELIRGHSLEQLLRDHGLMGEREAASIGIDLCRALAAVHAAGIVHRDVKAQNAMRESGGRILLMDFGAGIEARPEDAPPGARITGTPFYMPPELLRGQPATPQADLYALGVVLYRLVSGRFPVEAGSWEELIVAHERGQARLLRDVRPDLAENFVSVVERAINPDPTRRFASAGQMEQALARVTGGATSAASSDSPTNSTRVRDRRSILLAAALVAALAVGAVLTLRPGKPRAGSAVPGTASTAPQPGAAATDPAASGAAPYTVEAAVYRVAAGSSLRERVLPGARLSLGDRVTLEFQASSALNVYVVDEDEAGHAFALFPLPGLDQQNPLAPGAVHVLPGARAGKSLAWTVDTRGGREHLLVLASAERLSEYEAEMSRLARPGQMGVPLPQSARLRLRGLGSLSEAPASPPQASAGRLFELAQRLASRSETVSGVWMRRIDLENPAR